MGIFKSILLKLKKEKIVKNQMPADLLQFSDFALNDISELKLKGPACGKDIKKIAEICKQYRQLHVIDLSGTTELLEISDNAFHGCESIEKIILPENMLRIGESAFESCRCLKEVVLPGTIETISKSAFYGCNSIRKMNLPQKLSHIGDWALVCGNLTEITVDKNNKHFKTIDGILFSNDLKILIKYPSSRGDFDYEIPESVTNIANGAFYNCSSLRNISFPSKLKHIGDNAFMDAAVEKIELPVGTQHIGKMAFCHCQSLSRLFLPGSVSYLGERAFAECNRLKSENIKIEDGITGIGDNVFANCHSLTRLDLPSSAYTSN